MNISYALLVRAGAATAVLGLSGIAASAGAQDAAPPVSTTSGGAPSEAADAAQNEELRNRVQAALHADPYFYDAHVTVSIKKGDVVLSGFVFSDWDMRNAISIAKKAAGDVRVVNNLSIKVGGRR
ncbi:MAG TPA: BON domain-containing protein [Steroidobacteraceae bacterium]